MRKNIEIARFNNEKESISHLDNYLITSVYILRKQYLPNEQIYVTLSRCRKQQNLKVFVKEDFLQVDLHKDGRIFTKNVVIKELLE